VQCISCDAKSEHRLRRRKIEGQSSTIRDTASGDNSIHLPCSSNYTALNRISTPVRVMNAA
jgi:hypothetical protein